MTKCDAKPSYSRDTSRETATRTCYIYIYCATRQPWRVAHAFPTASKSVSAARRARSLANP
eukprot:3053456-Pyramimonas_sp.AAC.1